MCAYLAPCRMSGGDCALQCALHSRAQDERSRFCVLCWISGFYVHQCTLLHFWSFPYLHDDLSSLRHQCLSHVYWSVKLDIYTHGCRSHSALISATFAEAFPGCQHAMCLHEVQPFLGSLRKGASSTSLHVLLYLHVGGWLMCFTTCEQRQN